MKLTVQERSTLLNLLPTEGTFDTLKSMQKVRVALSLSDSERDDIHWQVEYKCPRCGQQIYLPANALCGTCGIWMEATGQANYDQHLDPEKDIAFPLPIVGIIAGNLSKLNEKGKLTENLISVYEKFVVGGGQDAMR